LEYHLHDDDDHDAAWDATNAHEGATNDNDDEDDEEQGQSSQV